jgi:hypothetical protein
MIIKIDPDFVAWINEAFQRDGVRVEIVEGGRNDVRITTPFCSWIQHEVHGNGDLAGLMYANVECVRAQKRGQAMKAEAA